MTIGMWALVIVTLLAGGAITAFLIWWAVDEKSIGATILGVIIAICTLAICIGIVWFCSTSESGKRALKEQQSDLNGGLQRTVTLYSYDGEKIKSWTGKFDVSSSETETYFDIDGKRVIIHGGIVVNEESE